MQRPTLPRSNKMRLISLSSIAGGLGAIVLAASLITTGSAAGTPTPTASPSPSPTATPTETATPTPTVAKPTPPPSPPESDKTLPSGPINAERFRVHTGDGDCLNVRPSPGTQFKTEVLYCVPEGQFLWLYGPTQQVDGEAWRHALGSGWVAARYVEPAPLKDTTLPGGLKGGVIFSWNYGPAIAAIGRSGALLSKTALPGGIIPFLLQPSPDGSRFAAEGGPRGTVIYDQSGAELVALPGMLRSGWTADGKLLLRDQKDCEKLCNETLAYWDARSLAVTRLTATPLAGGPAAWAPDGKSILFAPAGRSLVRVALDGSVTPLPVTLAENETLYELVPSPDGNRLLIGGGFGPLRWLDLKDGSFHDVARAPARPIRAGNGCGAGNGRLAAWLDSTHIVYHEQFAAVGYNGLTIANLTDGTRKVLPFSGVADIRGVTPGIVSFTTYESTGTQGFQLVWLLDVAKGEPTPISVGEQAAWLK